MNATSFDHDLVYFESISGLTFANVDLRRVSTDEYGITSDAGSGFSDVNFNDVYMEDRRFHFGMVDLYGEFNNFNSLDLTVNNCSIGNGGPSYWYIA